MNWSDAWSFGFVLRDERIWERIWRGNVGALFSPSKGFAKSITQGDALRYRVVIWSSGAYLLNGVWSSPHNDLEVTPSLLSDQLLSPRSSMRCNAHVGGEDHIDVYTWESNSQGMVPQNHGHMRRHLLVCIPEARIRRTCSDGLHADPCSLYHQLLRQSWLLPCRHWHTWSISSFHELLFRQEQR